MQPIDAQEVTNDVLQRVSVIHTRAVHSQYVAVTFDNPEMTLVVRLVRCRPVGFFYELGGVFVRKL
jgi:hypothetical protein